MVGTCSTHGKIISACKYFIGESDEKRPPGKPGCRWEDNIRMGLWEIGW
jgi:hypothetical protein